MKALTSVIATILAGATILLGTFLEDAFGFAISLAIVGVLMLLVSMRTNTTTQTVNITKAYFAISLPLFLLVMVAWLGFGYGPVFSSASYPRALRKIVNKTGMSPIAVRGYGAFLDSEHVWSMRLNREQMRIITDNLKMHEVTQKEIPITFWKLFPPYSRPSKARNNEHYITKGFSGDVYRRDGDHCAAVYDINSSTVYIWNIFHF